MRSHVCIFTTLVIVLVVGFSSYCSAAFPKPDYYDAYALQQGCYNSELVWFTCTSTNNINWLSTVKWTDYWSPWFTRKPNLAPKLSVSLETNPKVARPVYVVTDSSQPPVFDTRPGCEDYSGLWQVFLVTWEPGCRRDFTNTVPVSDLNPNGLPDLSEAAIKETDVVVDCPILAVGRLGGSWRDAPEGGYRIPQGLDADVSSLPKWVMLPHYTVFVENVWTKAVVTADIAITDVADEGLAGLLGANIAPRLAGMPSEALQYLWVMKGPKPPAQLPMIEEIYSASTPNTNVRYTPAAEIVVLDRHMPQYVTVSSGHMLRQALANKCLTPSGERSAANVHVRCVWCDTPAY